MNTFSQIRPAPTFILSGDVELSTDHGPCRVAEIQAGSSLESPDGTSVPVLACDAVTKAGPVVDLPLGADRASMQVGAGMLVVCDHFLCAALFGQRKVAARAGDLQGHAVQQAHPSEQKMYRIEVARDAVISTGGYQIAASGDIAAPFEPAADEGEIELAEARGGDRAMRLLMPGEASQLSQSGILFRHLVQK